jgi:O-antigen/teichoic acid export membrane protein
MPSNTTRIAKNTLMLYFRQILIMLVSLYTVRVVLNTLGAEDYGIYNVVAGIVSMFGFLNNSMANAAQRFFSVEIGRGDFEQLKKVFSLILTIYILIIVIVLSLAETIGLWFVSTELVIPSNRRNAALLVYQCVIVSFIFTVLTAPYMAMILAHEDMKIYASVSIIEVVLKLGTALVLKFFSLDKLQLYGILIVIVTIINTTIYRIICAKKYQECKFRFYWDKRLFKEIADYTGWTLYGSLSGIARYQGVNVLLNQFFSPVVIASRSIASTINSVITNFTGNFNMAVRPQIIKNYVSEQRNEMITLIFRSTKATYFLMYVFILPMVLEMPTILYLWLNELTEYVVIFSRLTLIETFINLILFPVWTAVMASGKIRRYIFVTNTISILNIPLSWIIILFGAQPYMVMWISIFLNFIAFIPGIFMVGKIIKYFPVKLFVKDVILPIGLVTLISSLLPFYIYSILQQNFLRLCFVTVASIISVCGCMYLIGLDRKERKLVKNIILSKMVIFK